ncbi:MAG: biopolymer transporter ExbB [Alkalinema sp. CACIAM 70d]|nr:MAG: biopolymer transporter ExbB [Alkalinema sp. CACIAM 70d]
MVGLSVATLASALDRAVFWLNLYRTEDKTAHRILEASRYSLADASMLARQAGAQPIARFMYAALRLRNPTPDSFRLAMETASEHEFEKMEKGNKLLETVVALAPLMGLLGTVTGLMHTFENLNVGSGTGIDTGKAAAGIGEALTATAAGMIVAILAMIILRICVTLGAQQLSYFAQVGGELELIYRQNWFEPSMAELDRSCRSIESRYKSDETNRLESFGDDRLNARPLGDPLENMDAEISVV